VEGVGKKNTGVVMIPIESCGITGRLTANTGGGANYGANNQQGMDNDCNRVRMDILPEKVRGNMHAGITMRNRIRDCLLNSVS